MPTPGKRPLLGERACARGATIGTEQPGQRSPAVRTVPAVSRLGDASPQERGVTQTWARIVQSRCGSKLSVVKAQRQHHGPDMHRHKTGGPLSQNNLGHSACSAPVTHDHRLKAPAKVGEEGKGRTFANFTNRLLRASSDYPNHSILSMSAAAAAVVFTPEPHRIVRAIVVDSASLCAACRRQAIRPRSNAACGATCRLYCP